MISDDVRSDAAISQGRSVNIVEFFFVKCRGVLFVIPPCRCHSCARPGKVMKLSMGLETRDKEQFGYFFQLQQNFICIFQLIINSIFISPGIHVRHLFLAGKVIPGSTKALPL